MTAATVVKQTVTRGKGADPVVINRALCNGCGKCIERCTTGALTLAGDGRAQINEDLCLGLGGCIFVCPAAAIRQK